VATAVLTRPAGRNQALAQALQAQGVHCLDLPALSLTPTTKPMPAPQGFDLVFFASGFAAQCYLRAYPSAWPAGVLAAGVGQGTLAAIHASGVVSPQATLAPGADTAQDSEALWQTLQNAGVHAQRVLIVRGDSGRDWLRAQWQGTGAAVEETVAYHRTPCVWTPAQGQALQSATPPCVLLVTSSDSAHAIDTNFFRLGFSWERYRVLTVHARIAACVQDLQQAAGIDAPHQVAVCTPDTPAVVQALLMLARAGGVPDYNACHA